MPVLSEQQQNALGDRGNVDQERKAVRRHKPSGSMPNKKKKQARWSLGKDSKGRRISFGFRDENAQKSFTTPTRDRSNKYKNDSASAKFDDTVKGILETSTIMTLKTRTETTIDSKFHCKHQILQ